MSKLLDLNACKRESEFMPKKQNPTKALGEILRSPPKIGIVTGVSEEAKTFSELKNLTEMTNGTLNYHLMRLENEGLLGKDTNEKYQLTPFGDQLVKTIKKVIKESEDGGSLV
jgi:predicted transcriptional regulator